jgi:hypothetical protein
MPVIVLPEKLDDTAIVADIEIVKITIDSVVPKRLRNRAVAGVLQHLDASGDLILVGPKRPEFCFSRTFPAMVERSAPVDSVEPTISTSPCTTA